MSSDSDILDSYLVVDYQNGNQRSMALLVKRWHAKFCHIASWYTKESDSAQDIVQDAWQVIINRIDMLNDPAAFKSWATRIVINKAYDWLRKRQKADLPLTREVETGLHSEPIAENNDRIIADTRKAIGMLPKEQQEVVRLFYTEDYNLEEIALILAIPSGTVKSRLFHARERLKQILKRHIS